MSAVVARRATRREPTVARPLGRRAYLRMCASPIIRFGSDHNFLVLNQQYLDRTEGKPGRAGEARAYAPAKFVLMTRDGQEMEMLPATPPSLSGGALAAKPRCQPRTR